ncbi:helix-turn-helix domain-containing protein [Streptomyces sp. NPDC051315]|uniref:helix-turn-helix domain-containing protein n=1 Tax=Streptomyces sp. NPDC051315 TaxID=3365650 RepID=UPI00379FDF25
MSATEFAELLREFKERSGLSYGTLAKRLHMSTSTLHRYCNGDAVPTDYAPVERLARLCRATPAELVELHRRWVLADASRGRKDAGATAAEAAARPVEEVAESVVQEAARPAVEEVAEPVVVQEVAEPLVEEPVRGPEREPADEDGQEAPRGARRPLLLAATAAVSALGAVALVLSLTPTGGSDDDDRRTPAAASVQGKPGGAEGVSPSPSVSSPPSASASRSGSGSPSPSAAATVRPEAPASEPADTAPPLTVSVRPYAWESPCDQRYLINREPSRVGPPPTEQDAPAWVHAQEAVSSGQQYLELTVQGTGDETVVVEGLTVRTVDKRSPLAWNDYAMGYPGVGCGGGVPKRYFTVALDAARPALVPEAGSDDFPFKVRESDPEVYYVSADASAYDVRWVLELSWSSGSRRGTLTVDDGGEPFRTSGNNGRPAYEFPLGGAGWRRAGASPTP